MFTALWPTLYGPRSVMTRTDGKDAVNVLSRMLGHADSLTVFPIRGVNSISVVALKYLELLRSAFGD